jgi:hypothetical protein
MNKAERGCRRLCTNKSVGSSSRADQSNEWYIDRASATGTNVLHSSWPGATFVSILDDTERDLLHLTGPVKQVGATLSSGRPSSANADSCPAELG